LEACLEEYGCVSIHGYIQDIIIMKKEQFYLRINQVKVQVPYELAYRRDLFKLGIYIVIMDM
jgi:hypothetical protein